jgi:hypothetical protein
MSTRQAAVTIILLTVLAIFCSVFSFSAGQHNQFRKDQNNIYMQAQKPQIYNLGKGNLSILSLANGKVLATFKIQWAKIAENENALAEMGNDTVIARTDSGVLMVFNGVYYSFTNN